MTSEEIVDRINDLNPTGFENLVFDVVRLLGFQNIVWRTPGADGGRDIEGFLSINDPTGFSYVQKWHIECKKYSSSISWPLVWEKIAHADSLDADVLFLVTNSMPSPACEERITQWNNNRRRPAIRVWRGYNFPTLLNSNIEIGISHGIIKRDQDPSGVGVGIALELSKLVQSAHGAIEFEGNPCLAIEAASAMAELLEHRLKDLAKHNKFLKGPSFEKISDLTWLTVNGEKIQTEEVGFRCLVTMLRHLTQCDTIMGNFNEGVWKFKILGGRRHRNTNIQHGLRNLGHWIRCDDITSRTEDEITVKFRD
jgi:hypothetical protein